jgi:NAD+ diphosphatase
MASKSTVSFCPRCGKPLAERVDGGLSRPACPDASCGYVHYVNPTPVVAAVVEHEGAVILVRSKGWPEGWFGLVTGFLELGETPEQGIVREVKEELDLTGEVVGLIGVYAFFQMNQIIVAYHVRAEGTLKLGDELEASKAVPPEKLRPWPFGTGEAVRDWLKGRALGAGPAT